MTCFAAVDLGGQSGRVVLGSVGPGRLRYREVHRFANLPVDRGGRWYWDTDALFSSVLEGLAAAVLAAAAEGDRLAGIGVDTWGVDYGLVDASGSLVAPVGHHRSAPPALVDRSAEAVPVVEAYRRTGIEKAAMNTSMRLASDLRTIGGTATSLLTPDLFTFWLSGLRGAERTIASTTELLDVRTGDWALDLAARWGVDASALPPVAATGSSAGVTTPEVSARIGAEVPVYRVASHDTASAVAAATSAVGAEGVISCGSWALAGCVAQEPALSERARLGGFTNERSADGRILLLRNLSGLWLLEACLSAWSDGGPGRERAQLRTALLAAAEALPEGGPVIDAGAWELRAPGDMPGRIAHLAGRALDRPQTVRCIIDSLAAAFASALREASELTAVPMTGVHLLGGGSRVTALARATARATGLPVVAGPAEATSIGNLMVQAVAAGLFDDLDHARAAVDHGDDAPTTLEPA